MRRYDDPVEVRRGRVVGAVQDSVPEQFLWRGRLWKVRAVLASWVETGAWWSSPEVDAVLGAGPDAAHRTGGADVDLLAEREVWRVEAGSGSGVGSTGVFELAHDHDESAGGRWSLVGCVD